MAAFNKENLIAGVLSAAITSSTTGISVSLDTDTTSGAATPSSSSDTLPTLPFFATLSPAGVVPNRLNSEIVQVTAKAWDSTNNTWTFTVVRAQRDTTARAFGEGTVFSNAIYVEDTTYSNFTGTDGATDGAAGLVPAPATADAGKFLSASGNWTEVPKEVIQNAGAPTTSTAGTLGQLLTDTTNAKLYQLTAIDNTDPQNPSYTWSEVGGNSMQVHLGYSSTQGNVATKIVSLNDSGTTPIEGDIYLLMFQSGDGATDFQKISLDGGTTSYSVISHWGTAWGSGNTTGAQIGSSAGVKAFIFSNGKFVKIKGD